MKRLVGAREDFVRIINNTKNTNILHKQDANTVLTMKYTLPKHGYEELAKDSIPLRQEVRNVS